MGQGNPCRSSGMSAWKEQINTYLCVIMCARVYTHRYMYAFMHMHIYIHIYIYKLRAAVMDPKIHQETARHCKGIQSPGVLGTAAWDFSAARTNGLP